MANKLKKSVSLSVFNGTEASPMLFMGELEKNISTISELGYSGVDLFILEKNAPETQNAIGLLKRHNLGIGTIMPAGLAEQGLYLGDSKEDVREELIRRLIPIIELASEVGGMVSLGLIRGNVAKGDTIDGFLSCFADSCEKLIIKSERYQVPLLIEPINRYEINTLNSSIEALEFIKRTGLPLYLMLDTFHMNIEDASIEEGFRKCRDYIKHIHFVDSNRLAPGMGHLDMGGLIKVINEINYSGYLCLEALRKPDSMTVAENGIDFFKKYSI